MKRTNVWEKLNARQLAKLEALSVRYIKFISENKTERECVASAINLAKQAGYEDVSLKIKQIAKTQSIGAENKIKPGDKLYIQTHNKALILVHVGTEPMTEGFNILGAHLDSPRLDVKQNPLYESSDLVLLDTHYYGGIKKYQWVALPLALHGVVCKKDGSRVNIVVGEDESDPVFCITDILPHLGAEQMKREAGKIVAGEDLDLLCGSKFLVGEDEDKLAEDANANNNKEYTGSTSEKIERANLEEAKKEPARAYILKLLFDKYGIEEDDFLSAELEVVPAGRARNLGFDESMVLGYGQDDKVCAYTSLEAQLSLSCSVDALNCDTKLSEYDPPARTCVCVLVDKEEIGSVGASGMDSLFFENAIASIMDMAGCGGMLNVRRALSNSCMLSSDVSAGFDPLYASEFEKKNSAFLSHGLVFNKYTGARGKSGSNDASAEYMAQIRSIMDSENVIFQTAELGKVDAGGGGTIAYIPARYDMDVIDSGVPVLSMHAPWEVTSKADIYMAYLGYVAFLKQAGSRY